MKIALNFIYLSKKHAGGKDQEGLNLLKGLNEEGLTSNIVVICFDYSKKVINSIAPRVKIITLKPWKQENELLRMLNICYVNTFIIPGIIKKHNISLIYNLSCNTGLKRQNCVSVVNPQDIKAVSHRVLANVKIPFYKYVLYRIMYHLDFTNSDGIIAISDVDKAEICTFYKKFAAKVHRIYVPVDIKYVKRDLSKTCRNIVAINLQFHHKNIITLIKAFELIKDEIPHKLILVGSVPNRVKYLKEYVEEHHLQERVVFTGFVPDEERDKWLMSADLYVNPSLNEGFGMTAVESLIFEIPTLISKIPTNYEVTMGMCDYYEPPEDAEQLAKSILYCLNKDYNQKQYEECSIKMRETYDYRVIAKEYYKYWSSLIAK